MNIRKIYAIWKHCLALVYSCRIPIKIVRELVTVVVFENTFKLRERAVVEMEVVHMNMLCPQF